MSDRADTNAPPGAASSSTGSTADNAKTNNTKPKPFPWLDGKDTSPQTSRCNSCDAGFGVFKGRRACARCVSTLALSVCASPSSPMFAKLKNETSAQRLPFLYLIAESS
jgi:hypothetical protein